jgi:threonine synthase
MTALFSIFALVGCVSMVIAPSVVTVPVGIAVLLWATYAAVTMTLGYFVIHNKSGE